MRKTDVTIVALCATLLWAVAVNASTAGGIPSCEASLSLESVSYNTCSSSLTTADGSLSTCNANLATAELCEQCQQSILNGSKTCVTQGFFGGALQCGANCQLDTSGCFATRFTDNGDGTISDHQTGLMWEKQTGTVGTIPSSPPVTDVNNTYTWSTGDNLADGTAFTSFLATLNNGASGEGDSTTATITGCFANHCDWRLPSVNELVGIVDLSATGCGSGGMCIARTFGPTSPNVYWTATTDSGYPSGPSTAWSADFTGVGLSGFGGNAGKTDNSLSARAVRGGS